MRRARATRLSTLKGRSLEDRVANGANSVHEAKSFRLMRRARATRLSTLKGRSLRDRVANGANSVHEAKSFSRLGLRVPGPYRTP